MAARAGMCGEYRAALGLAWLSEYGCHSVLKLLEREGPEGVWAASPRRLIEEGISAAAAARFDERRKRFVLSEAEALLRREDIRFLPFRAPLYPRELAQLDIPPAGLFVRGSEEALQRLVLSPRVTIVGTRKASAYGLRVTEAFAAAFATNNVVVVSGMALGVDARAHEAALGVEGLTVAVLGCGVDVVYPPRYASLYAKIARSGVVMSELPPGSTPSRWTFPHRNRLLAALGDAVMVTEAPCRSGALQTAAWALELGRPVWSVPGSVLTEGHKGCNLLIYDGAFPALDPCATVEDFSSVTRMERGERRSSSRRWDAGKGHVTQGGLPLALVGRTRRVLDLLGSDPCSVDDLVKRTGLPAREITAGLAELELMGRVARMGPGLYIRAP